MDLYQNDSDEKNNIIVVVVEKKFNRVEILQRCISKRIIKANEGNSFVISYVLMLDAMKNDPKGGTIAIFSYRSLILNNVSSVYQSTAQ